MFSNYDTKAGGRSVGRYAMGRSQHVPGREDGTSTKMSRRPVKRDHPWILVDLGANTVDNPRQSLGHSAVAGRVCRRQRRW